MPWTLSYNPPANPQLLNMFLLAVGKALCLANNFESKCNHVLRVITITDAIREGKNHDQVREVALSFEENMLGKTITRIGKAEEIRNEQINILEEARKSRNFVAHCGAKIGELYSIRDETFSERISELIPHVQNLAKGDNLVSAWTYEISEREPAPLGLQQNYPQMVHDWVFGEFTLIHHSSGTG